MGKKAYQWIREAFRHSKELGLKSFLKCKWGSNQRRLIGIENLEVGGKNEEGNKTFMQNNEWESQMAPTHPLT
jgi:hypothetical protein